MRTARVRKHSADLDARSRIVLESARLFASVGYRRATLRDIARGCGIQAASIFHYFASKEDILHEVMETTIRHMLRRQERALAGAGGTAERLRGLVEAEIMSFASRSAEEWPEVLVHEWRQLPPARQAGLLALRAGYEARWIEVLAAAQREGLVAAEPKITRRLLNGAFAWAPYWFREERGLKAEGIVDQVMQLIVQRHRVA